MITLKELIKDLEEIKDELLRAMLDKEGNVTNPKNKDIIKLAIRLQIIISKLENK